MIYGAVNGLIDYAVNSSLITDEDRIFVRNHLIDILKLTDWQEESPVTGTLEEILDVILGYAVESGIIEDMTVHKDLFDTKIMGVFTPYPHEVNAQFYDRYKRSAKEATDWYFDFSQKLNYVRAGRIAKDIKWTYESADYGALDITINRSKPEKDPKEIAAAKTQKQVNYPKCQICAENMGYAGRINHPARQNLVPISIDIHNHPWYVQYSPYGYYNEHCIVFNKEHTPMVIDDAVFEKLFDFVEQFPHYFIGSNADLPIVGGSILTHEHFQGGNYTFAMAKAPVEKSFSLPKFPSVSAGIVKWPMSVIRLCSDNRSELSAACADILAKWRAYTDADADIFAQTDGVPHNTITPIARMNSGKPECDLVLRNNRTTEEHPLGIFHPHAELHHIKKENIGLIEVMGLAVLPSRLAVELDVLEQAMLSGADLSANAQTAFHAAWAKQILAAHPEFCADNAQSIIRSEVGKVFEQVLCDAGVYKRTEAGMAAFERFVEHIVK